MQTPGIIRSEVKKYTECDVCGYRKWCTERGRKMICTSCVIDPEHWKKLKRNF